jgi:hypothetical protein
MNNSNVTAQDKTNKRKEKKQQKQRKMDASRLLTRKQEFLKISVSSQTAFWLKHIWLKGSG